MIGIIAILAGVALGPITSGIRKAQQSGAVQSARTLQISEFQFANDNNQLFPYGTDAGAIANSLVSGGYVSDPGIFLIVASTNETKYTGSTTPPAYTKANVSWDFGIGPTTGLNSSFPDECVAVISSGGGTLNFAAGVQTATVGPTSPFGTAGMAVCYKNSSAKFLLSPPASSGTTQYEDASWIGFNMTTAAGNG